MPHTLHHSQENPPVNTDTTIPPSHFLCPPACLSFLPLLHPFYLPASLLRCVSVLFIAFLPPYPYTSLHALPISFPSSLSPSLPPSLSPSLTLYPSCSPSTPSLRWSQWQCSVTPTSSACMATARRWLPLASSWSRSSCTSLCRMEIWRVS